jgi:alpha-L-fucosidase
VIAALQHGDPAGTVWRPAEADTSIRPGWFHHPAEDSRVQSVDSLVQLYFRSAGHNAKLLLNVPPTRDGVFHETDVSRLAAFRDRLTATFERDLAAGRSITWRRSGDVTAVAELDLGRAVTASIVRLEEPIERGQTIARYTLLGSDSGEWRELSRGTTIGYARLDRFEPATIRRVRIVIEDAVAPPEAIGVKVYGDKKIMMW